MDSGVCPSAYHPFDVRNAENCARHGDWILCAGRRLRGRARHVDIALVTASADCVGMSGAPAAGSGVIVGVTE